MTVTVSPNSERNTHHVKLADFANQVGLILCNADGSANPRAFTDDPIVRSSIKMYTGEQALSDLEPPWQDVVLDDFSGGRGSEDFEVDTTKYWDGRAIDTTNKGIILGPMEIWDRGLAIGNHNTYWPQYSETTYARKKYTLYSVTGESQFIATSFVASGNYTAVDVYFYGKRYTSLASPAVAAVYIYPNVGGSPGGTLVGGGIPVVENDLGLCHADITAALTSGTTYWLVFDGGLGSQGSNCIAVVCDGAGSGEKISTDGSTWSSGTTGIPYYRIDAGKSNKFRAHFAELKGALYCAAEYDNAATSKVFVSGLGGVVTSGTTTYIRDNVNSATIADNIYNGGIVRIVDGKLHHMPSPWRYISSTADSNSEITVTPAWAAAPDTTSVYAIVGSDRWTEVTGHGLAANEYITDACAVNGAIYFGCGPGTLMVRLRQIAATSTYWNWTDESGYGTFVKRLSDAATTEVWIANRTMPATIQSASALDCTGTATVTSLTFTSINCGDLGDKVTGLQVYGEETPEVIVFKERSIYRVTNGVPVELRISGYSSAGDERNGYASGINDVYLYFSFLDSVERYYSGSLDDIGPNKDGGLPYDRRGLISSFAPYPGVMYASIDGGNNNYSSIICWNGMGWHEIWRAPTAGIRIYGKLYIQPLPGDNTDRMYFSWNGDIISLCVLTNPFYHNSKAATEGFQYYMYAPGGFWESGWIHFGLKAIEKLFNAVTVYGKNLSSTYSRVFLDYMLDDDDDWTAVGQFTISNDVGELSLDDTYHNITGKRIRIRIRLETLYNNSTPRIDAVIVEGLSTVPSKQHLTLTFRVEDNGKTLLEGVADDIPDADTKISQLRTWAASSGTIAMSGHIDELDGKRVKLDYPSLHVLKHKVMEVNHEKQNRYIMQIGAWVID